MSLSKYTKKRNGYHLNARRLLDEAVTLTDPNEAEVDNKRILTVKAALVEYQQKLDELDNKILPLIDDENDAAIAAECKIAADWQDEILQATCGLDAFLTTHTASNATSNTDSASQAHQSVHAAPHHTQNARLPKLDVFCFDGDPIKWIEFWDTFSSTIHERTDLSDVEKLKYLKSYLTDDAKNLVAGYRTQGANYPVVVNLLQERYGNEEVAIHAHIRKLLSVSMDEAKDRPLQHIYFECEKHIRSLVALGMAEDTFGKVFTSVILEKLPKSVLATLQRQRGNTPWNLAALRTALRNEIEVRESSERYAGNRVEKRPQRANVEKPKPVGDFKNPQSFRPTQGVMANASTPKTPCPFCRRHHFADQCPTFTTVKDRKAALNGACFKCLREGHRLHDCPKRSQCYHCKQPTHHASLCPSKDTGAPGSNASSSRSKPTENKSFPSLHAVNQPSQSAPRVQLQMALAQFQPIGLTARVFFDSGCSRSYATKQLVNALGIPVNGEEVLMSARFGERTRTVQRYGRAILPLQVSNDNTIQLRVLVAQHLTCPIQKYPIDVSKNPILSHIKLADTLAVTTEDVNIDLVIGQDHLHDLLGTEKIQLSNGMYLLDSKLGYILSGVVPGDETDTTTMSFVSQMECVAIPAPDPTDRMWSLDAIGIKDDPYQQDDDKAAKYFTDTIRRNSNGRYEVRWPFKDHEPTPPSNFGLAYGSLQSLLKRLHKQPLLLAEYHKTIQSQVASEIIEECKYDTFDGPTSYLPHHPVVRQDKQTTKVRIVFNASAKSSRNQCSLNDCLMRGPVLLRNLVGILLRFRIHNVAVTADIEKAFLQVGLQVTDRDVTRFLWVRDIHKLPDPSNLIIYRHTRVPFGFMPSSFLLDATIEYHLSTLAGEVPAEISKSTYVDNVATGQESDDLAIAFYAQAKSIFTSIAMNLREWYSNSQIFMQKIPEADRGNATMPKVLGLAWHLETDTLACTSFTDMCGMEPTKRKLVQSVATLYDPCGFFNPAILPAKAEIQRLWKEKVPWDAKLSPSDAKLCIEHCQQLTQLQSLRVPRKIKHASCNSYQLHCFTDASQKAYGAAVYLRSISSNGKCESHMIFSKLRLATIKPITIPRLELLGTLIGCRILQFVRDELQLPIERTVLWCDSKCTLSWIHSDRLLAVFVENRVRELRKFSQCEYRYVPTCLNPADLLSRGMTPEELESNHMWWHGPSFLTLGEGMWPENTFHHLQTVPEIRGVSMAVPTQNLTGIGAIIDLQAHSKLERLLRVTCYVLRMVKKSAVHGPIELQEMKLAEQLWLQYIQQPLIADAKSNRAGKTQFKDLNAYIDETGIVRCKGRLENAPLPRSQREPILLPRPNESRFSTLVIQSVHERSLHAGASQTLSALRETYWIPGGKAHVKAVVQRCTHCRRTEGGPFKLPETPALPSFRVTPSPPFATCGIDYFGPLQVKAFEPSHQATQKVWTTLFTCAVTRAVHLEVVTDYSAEQFLLSLRRFVAMYGAPELIVSDNAANFKTVRSALQAQNTTDNDLRSYSQRRGIAWQFIPEYSPWFGGFYERLVGTVKRCLRKVLGARCMTLVQLQTIVAEIAATVNARPLTAGDSENPNLVLTPAHFLAKGGRSGLPYANVSTEPRNTTSSTKTLLQTWRKGQEMLTEFWNAWSKEYLARLRERPHHNLNARGTSTAAIKVGAVVIVKQNQPRVYWPLATIRELITSSDGQVRTAKVETATGSILTRPLKLLYPLEVDVPDDLSPTQPLTRQPRSSPRRVGRPIHTDAESDDEIEL